MFTAAQRHGHAVQRSCLQADGALSGGRAKMKTQGNVGDWMD